MTERAHPLDSVVEAIAGLIARFTTCASLSGSDPEYVAEATVAARAALQVARQMREAEPVAWAIMDRAGISCTYEHRYNADDELARLQGLGLAAEIVPLYALPLAPEGAEEGGHGE